MPGTTTVTYTCPACKLARTEPRNAAVDLKRYIERAATEPNTEAAGMVPCVVTARQLQLHDVVRTWGVAPFGFGVVIDKTEHQVVVRWEDPVDGADSTVYPIERGARSGHFLRIEADL